MKAFKKIKEMIKKIMPKKKLKRRPVVSEPEKGPQVPMPVQTKVEEVKFYTGPQIQERYPVQPSQLPTGYSQDKIVLQTRDPYWIHAYWELTPQTQDRLRYELQEDFFRAQKALRVYDVSHIIFDGTNAHRYFDIQVNEEANNWYINTGGPGRSWCVDFGLKLADGRFITMARSNTVYTPLDGPSWITDEEWMIPEETFARLYGIGLGLGLSSPVRKGWQEKIKKKFLQPLASPGISSLVSPVKRVPRQKGFWLVANTELIVYGATEPDAKITVGDQPVKLRPDGTFSLRYSLPNGKQFIPVKAVSSDRLDERAVNITVTKQTR